MSKISQAHGNFARKTNGSSGGLRIVPEMTVNAAAAKPVDAREERLFRALDGDNDQQVLASDLEQMLVQAGLRRDDFRLRESMAALDGLQRVLAEPDPREQERAIPKDRFCSAIRHNILLIERALQGHMVIPDFTDFAREIDEIYKASRANRDGRAADYIPQLDLKGPELDQYGVAICTVDAQRYGAGDSQAFFPVESTCKPVNYCLALEEHGEKAVHTYIGHEPSGVGFNELTLDKRNRPHNPMINAGAIMSGALIKLSDKRRLKHNGELSDMEGRGWAGARFDYVMERWQALCGGEKPRFDTAVFLSERETADRNFALAHYMREKRAFPDDVDLHDVLEFYFQSCSIELNAEMMSVVAATLANGGICPVTGRRVFSTETVQSCLSMMSASGMYNFSGEFAFTMGLPAKSGVSGAIMIVVPNVMGLCTWSPRLDCHGNSIRGLDFCRRLVGTFNFHCYDSLTGRSSKKDPRVSGTERHATKINELIWAASKGDLGAVQNELLRGAALDCADYDLRTPLHLAAAENQIEVVHFFVERKAEIELNPRDRWGGTPLDDAYTHGNSAVIEILEAAGGRRGKTAEQSRGGLAPVATSRQAESHKTAELIWAASRGDMATIYRLVAQGIPLDIADYDLRTPLHLAAAEGRLDVVRYLIAHRVTLAPRDRWGNTPRDDAVRHDHADVVRALSGAGVESRGQLMAKQRTKPATSDMRP